MKVIKINDITPIQSGMLFQYILTNDKASYMGTEIFDFKGNINVKVFKQVLERIVDEYEIFRTNIIYEKLEKPKSIVLEERQIPFLAHTVDSPEEKKMLVEKINREQFERGVDIQKDSLIRLELVQYGEDSTLIFTFHHILLDGYCAAMIADIIMNCYGEKIGRKVTGVADYVPFTVYQDWLVRQNAKSSQDYWKKMLRDNSGFQPLEPVQFQNDKLKHNGHCSLYVEFTKEETEKLSKIAADNHTTLNIVLQWLWGLTICRNASSDRAVFGTVASYRPSEIENANLILGPMINTIPIVFSQENNELISQQIQKFSKSFVESMNHSWIGLGEIQKHAEDCDNLIDHLFVYDNFPEMDFSSIEANTGFQVTDFKLEERTEYALTLEVSKPENIKIRFNYDSDKYSGESIKRLAELYKNISVHIVNAEYLSDISNISAEEEEILSNERMRVKDSYRHTDLSTKFAEIVNKYGEADALEFNGTSITYKKLDELSDKLAGILYEKGYREGAKIAIDITPSMEVIIAILAIIKVGACYIPFDLLLPEKRLTDIIADAAVDVVLTYGENTIETLFIPWLQFNMEELENYFICSNIEYKAERNENSISNIMFTSGTTLKPKGVILRDGGILGFVTDIDYMDYDKVTCQFQNSSIAFDAATYEIWAGLLNAKKLVIIDKNTFLSHERFAEKIKMNKGCSVFLTTTLFNNFVDRDAKMFQYASYVVTGGEKFSEAHGKKFLEACRGVGVINAYGPTEGSSFTTCFEVTPDSLKDGVPIGKPVNTRGVMICDNNGNPLPAGSVGELYIYGQGLAEGYCNDMAITNEKFVPIADGTMVYKSGDYGYEDDNGNIYYRARRDEQLKLRGFRISTGEIENALRECNDVVNAAVIAHRNSKNAMFLVAYVVTTGSKDDFATIQSRITGELDKILPYYMIPSEFIKMDSIPVNSNGKLDKSKLKVPELKGEDIVLPKTKTEKKVYELFQEVITDCDFGMEHSFIKIGGDSIKAMKLISIAKKQGFNINVADLYREQTPARLAIYIDSCTNTECEEIKEINPDMENRYETFPLNNVQVAYLSGRSKDLVLGGYGTVFFGNKQGNYQCEQLNNVLNILIRRHDMLRAVIYDSGNQQILHPEDTIYNIVEKDIRTFSRDEQKKYLETRAEELKKIVFETGQWPMFSVEMVRTDADNTHIFYAFDALIMDAFSVLLLANELEDLYNGKIIGEQLQLSFRDYIIEMRNRAEEREKDKQYWMEKVADFPGAPMLKFKTLPEKLLRPGFARKHICLGKEVWQNIKELSAKVNVTPAVLLCGFYAYTLSLYSGQSKLAVNLTVFHREQIHSQVEKILGDFTKIVLLDYDFANGSDFKEIISDSHCKLNEYLTHLQFDGIDFMRELSRVQKPVNGRPLIPIVFTSALYDTEIVYDFDKAASRTPQVYLDCQAMLQCGELHIVWDYPEELFEHKMMDCMFEVFTEFIRNASAMLEKRFPRNHQTVGFFEKYNNTTWEHPELTLQQLVKDSLENPDYKENIWLYNEAGNYTYEQTRVLVNKYAAHLQTAGVGIGDFVCIEGERTPETLFMILATVLCGAAYIPVQAAWPEKRKEDIASLSQCKYWFKEGIDLNKGEFRYEKTKEQYPAYVIYTSGSTGKPKGVLINQVAVTNTILDMNDRFTVNKKDIFAGVSSFSFDLSVYDIFGSLYAGAGLSLIGNMKNINAVLQQLQRDKVTIWNTVPALMGLLVAEMEHKAQNKTHYHIPIRLVLLSGDWIPVQLPAAIRGFFEKAHMVSLGGATEASIWSIAYDIEENVEYKVHIPYGYPLRNQTMYVLSEALEPLPAGVEGDIYIGGNGVADGYQNDIEQTEAAFIQHSEYGRIYRTGDYGYMSENGWMEFCGRKDFQVKVNGLRIELGDIDSTIKKIPGIEDSVSTVLEKSTGGEYLCSYVQRAHEDSGKKKMNHIPLEYMKTCEKDIISKFDIESYKKVNEILERYSVACMAEAFIKMGITGNNGKCIEISKIPTLLNIAENRHVNFRQWFKVLKEKGIIEYNNGIFYFFSEKTEKVDEVYRMLKNIEIPDYLKNIISYMTKVREKLPEIMYGTTDPLSEIFFEGGSIENGVNVYRNSITGQIYGPIAAELTSVLTNINPEKPFRILEVGAGVGGTTDYIINRIKEFSNVSYTFTDLSDVFLNEARKRYEDCEFVEYGLFDINKHPRAQGMELHKFDLIIGANVFHDAHNIDLVIDNMQLLLANEGKIMIIEATVNTAAQMITAGFLEGLTAYEDDRVETDLPAYSEEQWEKSIAKSRYTETVMFPQDADMREALQTSLILAESRQMGSVVDEGIIIQELEKQLPDYMIPKFVVEVQKFPLTDNGKLDRKKLPQISINTRCRAVVVEPQTAVQKKLVELWKENLGVEEIGITDNYFAMGGDSLKAIRLMSRIEEAGYHIDMNTIFRCTNIKEVAAEIEKSVK